MTWYCCKTVTGLDSMHECRILEGPIASSSCKGLFTLLSLSGLDLTAKRRSCVTVVSSSSGDSSSRAGSDSNAGRTEPNPSCPAGILTCLLFSHLSLPLSFPFFSLSYSLSLSFSSPISGSAPISRGFVLPARLVVHRDFLSSGASEIS